MAAPASASWRSPVVESAVGGGHTDKVGETHSQSALGEDTQVPETVGETVETAFSEIEILRREGEIF